MWPEEGIADLLKGRKKGFHQRLPLPHHVTPSNEIELIGREGCPGVTVRWQVLTTWVGAFFSALTCPR